MKLSNKKIVYSLENELPERHIGEYFQIIKVKNKYHLYYSCKNTIKVVISDDLSFKNCSPSTIINEAPGGSFCLIVADGRVYMLCGAHVSNKEAQEIKIPDLVWPKEKRTVTNWLVKRNDRKNGMYLLSSVDGIEWQEEAEIPVMHSYVASDTCTLGEVCYDTSPSLVKYKEQFLYYGRLNSSLDERQIFVRNSTDLRYWSPPQRVNVINEVPTNRRRNYYNTVLFEKGESLYMLAPYFEACGTEARNCSAGGTVLLRSKNGVDWEKIGFCMSHEGKYKHRVNSICEDEGELTVFFRENVLEGNQQFVSYKLELEGEDNET